MFYSNGTWSAESTHTTTLSKLNLQCGDKTWNILSSSFLSSQTVWQNFDFPLSARIIYFFSSPEKTFLRAPFPDLDLEHLVISLWLLKFNGSQKH